MRQLPTARPRALLINEIDKSDIDLPNDLLNVLEGGSFEIPELSRLSDATVHVREDGGDTRYPIERGKVVCKAFPFIVIGANSILIYVMSWTVQDPIQNLLHRHFGDAPFKVFGEQYHSQLLGAATLAIMFAVLLWFYRRRAFVKI